MARAALTRLLLAGCFGLAALPSPGAAGSGPRRPDASDDPISVRFRWSAPADCSAHAKAELVSATPPFTVKVINFGEEPIRDLTVCVGGACGELERGRVVSPDEIVQISLPLAAEPSARIAIRCAVLLPSAEG